MPKGPQGQKRPADVIGNAIRVARIATGEEPEDLSGSPKTVERGKRGGDVRAASLTEAERVEIAKKAAEARWSKVKLRQD